MKKYVEDYTLEGFVEYLKTRAKMGPFVAYQHRRGRGFIFTSITSKRTVAKFKRQIKDLGKNPLLFSSLHTVEFDGTSWCVEGPDAEALYSAVVS